VLRDLLSDPAISREPAAAKLRLQETLELLETLTVWSDEMLRLDTDTLSKVLKLGARIKKLMARPPEDDRTVSPAHLLGP
jgi:hypothetical protein